MRHHRQGGAGLVFATWVSGQDVFADENRVSHRRDFNCASALRSIFFFHGRQQAQAPPWMAAARHWSGSFGLSAWSRRGLWRSAT